MLKPASLDSGRPNRCQVFAAGVALSDDSTRSRRGGCDSDRGERPGAVGGAQRRPCSRSARADGGPVCCRSDAGIRGRSVMAAQAAQQLGARADAGGGRRPPRPHLGAAPAANGARRPARAGGAAAARVRCRRPVRARLGRTRTRVRLARQRARRVRRPPGQCLDRGQQPDVDIVDQAVGRHAAEVHQGGQVPAADWRARQGAR